MVEKIGDALKKAIAQERAVGEVAKDKESESLLLNTTRLEIFQFLCKSPCSRLRAIARALDVAVPTVDWHLRKMVDRGLITVKAVGKNKIFYPKEMIDPEDIEVLCILSGDKSRLILRTIVDNPGITQSNLGKTVGMYQQEVGWYTTNLTERGVLSCVRDGRFKHYYVNEDLEDVLRSDRKRRNLFKKTLIKSLKRDGLNPEIVRSRGNALIIEISRGKEKMVLKVNLSLIPGFLQETKPVLPSEPL